jgi:hypothetical protein
MSISKLPPICNLAHDRLCLIPLGVRIGPISSSKSLFAIGINRRIFESSAAFLGVLEDSFAQ